MQAADLLERADELGRSVRVVGLLGELDDVEQALDANAQALVADVLGDKVHLALAEALELVEHVEDLGAARHRRHVDDLAEGLVEAELLDELLLARRGDEQQPLALRRHLLEQQLERLQHKVGEARTDGRVVQQRLDLVHHHAAQLRLVCVIEYLFF